MHLYVTGYFIHFTMAEKLEPSLFGNFQLNLANWIYGTGERRNQSELGTIDWSQDW